jgi:hypothetical protein
MPKQKRRPAASPVPVPATPPPAAAKQQQQRPGGAPSTRDGLVAKLGKGYGKASNYQEIMGFMLDQAVRSRRPAAARPPARPGALPRNPSRRDPNPNPNPPLPPPGHDQHL